jgi:hypothetical protein
VGDWTARLTEQIGLYGAIDYTTALSGEHGGIVRQMVRTGLLATTAA